MDGWDRTKCLETVKTVKMEIQMGMEYNKDVQHAISMVVNISNTNTHTHTIICDIWKPNENGTQLEKKFQNKTDTTINKLHLQL